MPVTYAAFVANDRIAPEVVRDHRGWLLPGRSRVTTQPSKLPEVVRRVQAHTVSALAIAKVPQLADRLCPFVRNIS